MVQSTFKLGVWRSTYGEVPLEQVVLRLAFDGKVPILRVSASTSIPHAWSFVASSRAPRAVRPRNPFLRVPAVP